MRTIGLLALLLATSAHAAPRGTVPFDAAWLFATGDLAAAEGVTFADAGWTRVDLPHD